MVKKEKKELNSYSTQFLDELLEKSYKFAQHLDAQTNILVGLSSAIFLFSVSRFFDNNQSIPFFILTVFAGLSSLCGLFAIHPPRFMRKRGQQESLMYHKHIISFLSPTEYKRQLVKILGSEDLILEEYATEIYNVNKYYYCPKRRLFHMARNFLIIGIVASFVGFLSGFVF